MPIVAIFWNIVFVLAVWETVGKARQIGLSRIRFLTSSTKAACVLMLVGLTIGIGMLVVAYHLIAAGDVHEFCRRCFSNDSFSYTSRPFSYLITVAAIVEVSLVGFFVVLLAYNSFRFIRGNT